MTDAIRCYYLAGHERFDPRQLLELAVHAERSGFDGIACSPAPPPTSATITSTTKMNVSHIQISYSSGSTLNPRAQIPVTGSSSR